MKAGVILVILGLFFLLKDMGFLAGVSADIFWPVIVIIIGLWLIMRRGRHHCVFCHGHMCDATCASHNGHGGHEQK